MSERLKSIKTEKEVALRGVTIQTEVIDGNIKSVKIIDALGGFIVVRKLDAYSDNISILVPEPPKEVDIFTVKHTIADTDYEKAFTDRFEAEQFMQKIQYIEGISVEIVEDKIEVPAEWEKDDGVGDLPF